MTSGSMYLSLITDLQTVSGVGPQIINLENVEKVTFGRGSQYQDVDIFISALKDGKNIISRRHAVIVHDNGKYIINDIGALNGIYVNGMRILKHTLANGDIVQFGGESKVPPGLSLKNSDVCIKYQLYCKSVPPIPSVQIRAKSPDANTTDIINLSSKRQKVQSRNSNIDIIPDRSSNIFVRPVNGITKSCIAALANESYMNDANIHTKKVNGENDKNRCDSRVNELIKQVAATDTNSSIRSIQKHANGKNEPSNNVSATSQNRTSSHSSGSSVSSKSSINNFMNTDLPQTIIRKPQDSANDQLHREIEELIARQQATESELLLYRSKCDILQRQIETTKMSMTHVTSPENETNNLSKVQRPTLLLDRAMSLNGAQPVSSCAIDASALQMHLNCPLCGDTLLDAVVTTCSHGFCRVCLEKHLRKSKQQISMCPICDERNGDSQPERRATSVTKLRFHRSEHIDAVVWLLLEASDEIANQRFKDREVQAAKELQALGIDPHAPVTASSWGDTNKGDDCGAISDKRKQTNAESPPPPNCYYCGADDHNFSECPHDDRRSDVDEDSIDDEEEDL